ncbi:MAG: TerB family tellurite resistance protein [Bacteroidales bacterium]|nr:TerB family tellurite resistance protein [Bacteroidales bacterium]
MKEKLSLLTELIKLAKCDNELREMEYNFLLTIAQSLNVSQEDFDNLFENYIEFTPPESEFERILQFHRLVLLMNIDQETSDEELNFLRDIGIRIGLNSLATDQVLIQMENYPNKVIPPDKLIEIFRENYN